MFPAPSCCAPRLAAPHPRPAARWAATLALACALAGTAGSVQARATPSQASMGLSVLPVAVSVASPALLLSAGAQLTVVSVTAAADGSVWVLERAADGARASLTLAGGAAAAVGTAVVVSALSTGWVLSVAGQAVCFIPNEIGAALLHNEQVTR